MTGTSDWYDIELVREGIYRIREGAPQLPCHSYLLVEAGAAMLVDTGLGIGDLRGLVEDIAGTTPRVILTHAHWDHLGAAHQFDELRVHPREQHADGRVTLDVFEERFDHRPDIFLEQWQDAGRPLPAAFDPGTYAIRPAQATGTLRDNDRVHVGEQALDVVAIPGHSPGQIALIEPDRGVCFGGDILEPGGTIYAQFADADLGAYRRSLRRLIERRDAGDFDLLLTGHGAPIEELSILEDALAALVAIEEEGPTYDLVDTHWGTSRQYALHGMRVLTVD